MTPTQPPPEPPHLAHNRALLKQVMLKTKTHSRYPKVSDQVECLPLETEKLHAFGYNPAINAKGLLAYRFHTSPLSTRLAVAQLGDNGNVLSNRALSIDGKTVDDPKLFTHLGDDYLSWVAADWVDGQYNETIRCVVKYAKFNETKVGEVIQPKLPGNDGTTLQKNYVFWSYEGRLMCLYQCHPFHRIHDLSEEGVVHDSDAPTWPYGEIRGGTPPLPYDGKLLRFFHSRLNNETFGPKFRYYLGAYLMEPEPPFKVVRVSRRPIIYGSEISGIPHSKRPGHYKANVVFVSGAIQDTDGWKLSVGENDSACLLCKVRPEQLNF